MYSGLYYKWKRKGSSYISGVHTIRNVQLDGAGIYICATFYNNDWHPFEYYLDVQGKTIAINFNFVNVL